MRTAALISLLLFGSLQAAIAPATSPEVPVGHLRFTDHAFDSPLTPAENPGAFKRLTEAPRSSALQRDWKLQKSVLAVVPGPAPDSDSAPSRVGTAACSSLLADYGLRQS